MRQIVLLILSSCCLSVTEGADVTDISRLRQDLLRNYDKNARPVQSHQNTTVVKIYFFNYGFEFDENTRLLTLHCLVALIWKDELIHWDPLLYGNLSAIQFYPTEVWRPDILVYNSYEKSELDHFGNTLIHAQSLNASNSILLWVPPASLVVECDNVDFYRWPYDKQRCSINLTAWAHDGSEISLQVQENHTKMDDEPFSAKKPLQNREWDLVDNSVEQKSWTEMDILFTEIQIRMDIQRRSSTHVAGIVVVAIGITVAILTSFWLNPFAKERIPVILVAFLLNNIYLNYIYSIIPDNGERVPFLVCYFRDSLVMVLLALAWTIGLRHMAKAHMAIQLPAWINGLLDGIVGTILCLRPHPSPNPSENSREIINMERTEDDHEELVEEEILYRGDCGWFANVLDRIMFLIYFTVYSFLVLTL